MEKALHVHHFLSIQGISEENETQTILSQGVIQCNYLECHVNAIRKDSK